MFVPFGMGLDIACVSTVAKLEASGLCIFLLIIGSYDLGSFRLTVSKHHSLIVSEEQIGVGF